MKLFAHLNEQYIHTVLEVGGRYVCGNPKSAMPVWSQENGGPLNYIQIEDLIAFIRAPNNEEFTKRDPELNEPVLNPDGTVQKFKGWRDPEFKPDAAATAVPDCWTGDRRWPGAVHVGRPERPGRDDHRHERHGLRHASRHGAGRHPVHARLRQPGRDARRTTSWSAIRAATVVDIGDNPFFTGPAETDVQLPGAPGRGLSVHLPVHPIGDDRHADGRVGMAKALPGRSRDRAAGAFFGFFDAEGWAWATTKAFFWLLVIIITLGYIPDRAYYFVVSRTIDLGILGWSPVNLCPPENGPDMPCPVPAGAVLPWQASPAEAALPQARTEGAAAQLGHEPAVHRRPGRVGRRPQRHTRRRSRTATSAPGRRARRCPRPAPTPRSRSSAARPTWSAATGRTASRPTRVWSIGLDPDTSALGTWIEGVERARPG